VTTQSARPDDHILAARAATAAGELLVRLRAELEADGRWPFDIGDEGDYQAHVLLMDLLRAGAPGDAILSEEGRDDRSRLEATRVWIIDPLDGTREYSEAGRSDWAVHVALTIGGSPVAGAVALPARRLTLSTDPPPPAAPPWSGPPRLVVSRSRPPHQALQIRDAIGGELLPLGSAGAKAMAVVLGEAEVYAHAGGQYEWDSCAPVAVAAAAGLHVSRLDGSPLVYNRPDPYLPDLLICRKELADEVLAAIT
jgi:3'-phosphoadenosine 5'-phosphosulfate (PAPS) 3'-phosphatase